MQCLNGKAVPCFLSRSLSMSHSDVRWSEGWRVAGNGNKRTKRVGGVHEFRHVFLVYFQQSLQHPRHLLLRRLAFTRDSHLDFSGAYS